MKKVLSFVLAGAMVLSLAACGDPGSTSGQAPGSAGSSTQVTEVTGLTEPIAETPALITSAGQSADASMLSAILEKAGFSCDIETSIGADSFDTSAYKTLIIGVGGSQKGLGAAGVDADVEQERVDAVVAKAEEADMTIIVAHSGGSARRGELSDGFISAVSPKADYLLVVAGGDDDGLFTQIASENGIPMDTVETLADVGTVLPKAFK